MVLADTHDVRVQMAGQIALCIHETPSNAVCMPSKGGAHAKALRISAKDATVLGNCVLLTLKLCLCSHPLHIRLCMLLQAATLAVDALTAHSRQKQT